MSSDQANPFLRPKGHPTLSEVVEGEVLIGSFPTPDDATWLRDEHGVRAVLSLQDDWDLLAKSLVSKELEEAYAAAGISFARIPIVDGDLPDVARKIDRVVERIQAMVTESAKVLVHCNAGYNRAPTAVIAWLHRYRGMTVSEADKFVRERRPCAPYTSVLRAKT